MIGTLDDGNYYELSVVLGRMLKDMRTHLPWHLPAACHSHCVTAAYRASGRARGCSFKQGSLANLGKMAK